MGMFDNEIKKKKYRMGLLETKYLKSTIWGVKMPSHFLFLGASYNSNSKIKFIPQGAMELVRLGLYC